jgi:Spy/CpxP family protein refolding chaperone
MESQRRRVRRGLDGEDGRICGKFQRKNVEGWAEHFAQSRVCTGDGSAAGDGRDASREKVLAMENLAKGKMFRTAVVVLCSAGLAISAAVAQQETAPPPPPDQQQQGPPPDGQMQGPMHGGRGMDPERRVEMMQRRLGLNDSQTAQVRQILTESRAQMETILRPKLFIGPDRAVLTPDQQAKYDAMQEKMRERRSAGEGESAPPPPPPSGAPQP